MTKQSGIIAEEGDVSGDETEADEESTHRAAMEAKFDEMLAGVDEEAIADPDVEIDLESDDEPKPRTAKERERDETGRFKPKNDKSAQVSGAEQTIEQPQGAAIESPQPEETPVLAPPSWAADEREAFAQAPRKAQEAIVRRETESRRAIQQATDRAAQVERTWSEVRDAIGDERIEMLGRRGATPGMAVKQLMKWQDYLDTDTPAALAELAQSYGLDLLQLAQNRAQQPQEPAYVRELRQNYQQLNGLLTQQQQQVRVQQQRSVESEIQAFASETDANGAPLRPHVEHVIEDMIPWLQQMRQQNPQMAIRQLLQGAYEKALWANPSTRELELKKSQVVQQPNLEKARRAAKIVNGDARAMNVPDEVPDSRAQMAAVWDKRVNGK